MPDQKISDLTAAAALADGDQVELLQAGSNLRADVGLLGGRIAIMVAANAASATIKARADYVCDGTADDVQIQQAIDAMPAAGGKVALSEGEFTLAAELTNTVDRLNLCGQGEGRTILKGDGVIDGISVTASLRVSHLRFETFAEAIQAEKTAGNPIKYIITNEVSFIDCDYSIRAQDAPSAVQGVGVDFLWVHGSLFDPDGLTDCRDQIQWFQPITERAEILHSRFQNIEASATDIRAIILGVGGFAQQDEIKRVLIHGCLFDDINGTSVAGDSDTQAVLIEGKEVIITSNHFENIRSADDLDCEGLYLNVRWGTVADNVFVDAGSNEAAIALKGRDRDDTADTQSYALVLHDNHIIFTKANTTGIEVETEDVWIHHNYIEGAEQEGINVAAEASDRVAITDNVIFGMSGAADANRVGIRSACQGNYHIIRGNLISNITGGATQIQQGIKIQLAAAVTPKFWTISHNVITDIDQTSTSSENAGLLIKPSSVIEHVQIVGNQFNSCREGMRITNSAMDKLWMEANQFEDITATEISFGGGAQPTNSHIDKNGSTLQDNGSSGANITPEPLIVQTYFQTLPNNITVAASVSPVKGMVLRFMLTQDATGGRTVTWNAEFKDLTAFDGTANKITSWTFMFNGSNWVETAAIAGA